MARPFETEIAFEVKSYDVDYVGYVHNAVYIRWLEDLRNTMLAAQTNKARHLSPRRAGRGRRGASCVDKAKAQPLSVPQLPRWRNW